MPSLAELVPEIAIFNQQRKASEDSQMGQLQQDGALQGILAQVRKQQMETQGRAALSELGPNATSEEVMAKMRPFVSPEHMFQWTQAAELKKATSDQTKQLAMSRLSQTIQKDAAEIAHKSRTAMTSEEKFHWQQQMDTLKAYAQKQAAEIAAGRYTYDTGGAVAPFQGAVPQAQPAAPAGAPTQAPLAPPTGFPPAQPMPGPRGGNPAPIRFTPDEEAENTADLQSPESRAALQQELARKDLPASARAILQGELARITQVAQGGAQATPAPTTPAALPVAPPAAPTSGAPTTPALQKPAAYDTWPQRLKDQFDRAQATAAMKATVNLTGGRESVYVQRMMMGANQASKDLANVVQLPLSASTGIFGGRKQGPGLFDAGKEILANKATSQEAQSYNAMATGFQRSLAQIESAGLMPSGSLTHQMDAVLFKEGDTNLSKMHKLAQTRQIIEAGMEVIEANPRVSPEEKAKIKGVLDSVRKSVPFTHSDLIRLAVEQEKNPNATLKDVLGPGPAGGGTGNWSIKPR